MRSRQSSIVLQLQNLKLYEFAEEVQRLDHLLLGASIALEHIFLV
jgi:hypothetical protein